MKGITLLVSSTLIATASLAWANAYDLDIVAPVQFAPIDAASADFQKQVLPGLQKLVSSNANISEAIKGLPAVSLDPSKLTLKSDSKVRIYFVGESAAFANSLGISTTGSGPLSPDAALIFPNASTSAQWGSTDRAGWAPLQPGDFVDVGTFKAGSKLDFFLIADGSNGGKEAFSTTTSENRDGLVHAVALAPEGSSYWLMAFEDIYGEKISVFNDLVFVVEMTPANLGGISAPEPSLALGMLLALGGFIGSNRRRRA